MEEEEAEEEEEEERAGISSITPIPQHPQSFSVSLSVPSFQLLLSDSNLRKVGGRGGGIWGIVCVPLSLFLLLAFGEGVGWGGGEGEKKDSSFIVRTFLSRAGERAPPPLPQPLHQQLPFLWRQERLLE